MSTPHIKAEAGDFAPVVVMPGDPLRSRFIAENYLTDARLVNDVRGVQGYTGYYFGSRVSVMASGMGMPSMGIYAYELFEFFGVKSIIRAGSAGGYSDGNIPASARLTDLARKSSIERNLPAVGGAVYSSDVFYSPPEHAIEWKKRGALAVEMETAMLYAIARKLGKDALAVLAVSDLPLTGASLGADERESSFTEMITLALDVAARVSDGI